MSVGCVLDTDVLIGVLDDRDAHHRKAAKLVLALIEAGVPLHMSVVNYAEALVRPSEDPETLRRVDSAIAALGIDVAAPTVAMGRDAARLRRSISLADGFALATALHLGAAVATFDQRVVKVLKSAGLERARRPS